MEHPARGLTTTPNTLFRVPINFVKDINPLGFEMEMQDLSCEVGNEYHIHLDEFHWKICYCPTRYFPHATELYSSLPPHLTNTHLQGSAQHY